MESGQDKLIVRKDGHQDCKIGNYDTNNGEFDPGSGLTLAAGLTHASRGAAGRKLAFSAGDRRTGE